jgi:hypothetical protein
MNGWDPALAMQLCGFGLPNEDRALYCREQRVTYYCEDEIEPDQIHLFEIFVPSEIHDGKGKKSIAVTLAYDPPTSVVDANSPAGIELNWNLARGDVPIAQVEKAIVAEATKEERTAAVAARKALREKLKKGEDVKKDKSPFMLNTELPKKIQSQGTVQKNVFVWEKKGKFGATYHLAVSAKAIRPVHQKDKQRYAVVVTLECQDPETKLYALSRAKMLTARARVKVGSETPAISSGEGKA